VSDRVVLYSDYKRACAAEDQGARLMASGYMEDLFGASSKADDYLVKTELVSRQVKCQHIDGSDQSLSHRSESISEELLDSIMQ
jgi:hypothetical protein